MKPDPLSEMPLNRRLLREQCPGGAAWSGRVDAATERLSSAGIQLIGGLQWSAQFVCSDRAGEDLIALQIRGRLGLSCTRCLAELQPEFSAERRFRLFDSAAQADAELSLEDGTEETLSSEDGLSLLALIEDELLLSAEELMRHEGCHPAVQPEPNALGRPFADLAALLHPKDRQ